jgi:hypothetical protein
MMAGRAALATVLVSIGVVPASACSPAEDNRAPVIELLEQNNVSPGGVAIDRGQSVLWWNKDDQRHQLALGDGSTITVEPGDVAQTTFSNAGTWIVRDTAATQMFAVVEVAPS